MHLPTARARDEQPPRSVDTGVPSSADAGSPQDCTRLPKDEIPDFVADSLQGLPAEIACCFPKAVEIAYSLKDVDIADPSLARADQMKDFHVPKDLHVLKDSHTPKDLHVPKDSHTRRDLLLHAWPLAAERGLAVLDLPVRRDLESMRCYFQEFVV